MTKKEQFESNNTLLAEAGLNYSNKGEQGVNGESTFIHIYANKNKSLYYQQTITYKGNYPAKDITEAIFIEGLSLQKNVLKEIVNLASLSKPCTH